MITINYLGHYYEVSTIVQLDANLLEDTQYIVTFKRLRDHASVTLNAREFVENVKIGTQLAKEIK